MVAAFATAAELDTHLQRQIAPEVATLALAGASGVIRAHCGWNLLRETITFEAEGDGTPVLTLPTMHLVDVTAVRIDGLPLATEFWTFSRRGQLRTVSYWLPHNRVHVDAVHGYEHPPDLVRLVALTVAARIVANPDDVTTASVGSVSRTYSTTLTALELRLLDIYRL